MHIRESDTCIEVWTPAKVNLFLEVLGRRGDGFHEIETLMTPVSLWDTLYFQKESPEGVQASESPSGTHPDIRFSCRWSSQLWGDERQEPIPEGPENTVVRAVNLLRERIGARAATVRLVKRIPHAAGLAGGSSDAAAALLAANLAWRAGLSCEQLADVAAQVGSDVPFFLYGGPAVCRGRGEQIQPVADLGRWHLVIVQPPAGLSTPAVYRECQVAETPRQCEELVEAMRRGSLRRAGQLLHNQLQRAAQKLSPWIERLEEEFDRLDVPGHQMSGSGASYFGLCRSAQHARSVAARLRARRVGRVFALHSCR